MTWASTCPNRIVQIHLICMTGDNGTFNYFLYKYQTFGLRVMLFYPHDEDIVKPSFTFPQIILCLSIKEIAGSNCTTDHYAAKQLWATWKQHSTSIDTTHNLQFHTTKRQRRAPLFQDLLLFNRVLNVQPDHIYWNVILLKAFHNTVDKTKHKKWTKHDPKITNGTSSVCDFYLFFVIQFLSLNTPKHNTPG